MSEQPWRVCRLGDVVELKRGYDLPESERVKGSVPVVSSAGITGWHSTAKVPGPGVVTGRTGTLGQVFYVAEDFWPLNTSLYVRDFKGNEARFVAYLLRWLDFAVRNAAGAVPGVNRNHLHALSVRVPAVQTQRRIADVLVAYDDLIENNRARIRVLNDMAHSLYREWFVRFRYPGSEMMDGVTRDVDPLPPGWHLRPLKDVADVIYGFPFRSQGFNSDGRGTPVVRIRDIPAGSSKTFTDEPSDAKYAINDGDILIGMDGEFHMSIWSGGPAVQNQRVAKFKPKKSLGNMYLFLALESPIKVLNRAITGTTVAHLGDKHITQIRIAIPPAEVLAKANATLEPMSTEIIALARTLAVLEETRDMLLPRLVSGKLTLPD